MKYLIIILLFTSCRACYTKSRYEKDIKNDYDYIEKTSNKNLFSDKRFAGKDSTTYIYRKLRQ